jgi:hypothetical protein
VTAFTALIKTISVSLSGSGPEARSVTIARRGTSETVTPIDQLSADRIISAIQFDWIDWKGVSHKATPIISQKELQLPTTGENLPDFFYFASKQTYSSIENADRFSEMSRSGRHTNFVELFKREYSWMIEDMSIETVAGAPAIYVSIK